MTEGILAGGSGGMAVARRAAGRPEIDDPEALVVVVLPDGGRSYLSKIYNDAWMTQHGFLERRGDGTVGDVLAAKQQDGAVPPLVTVTANQKVRDAIALLHEHGVSQLPVVSRARPAVGRRLDRRARAAQARRRRPGPARRRGRRT